MLFLILSFFAGVLTIAAPCVLPMLPVILGTAVTEKDKWKPYIIILSLTVSVVMFSILLKIPTVLFAVDPLIWKILSGGILIALGIVYIFPTLWDAISLKLQLANRSDNHLHAAQKKKGLTSSILIGAALGPVFTSCSPTYALIVATILPASFFEGLLYITAYALGLGLTFLLIALLGRRFLKRLTILSNPSGWVRRALGVLLVVVGVAVIFGIDKQIETSLVNAGVADWIIQFEQKILDAL